MDSATRLGETCLMVVSVRAGGLVASLLLSVLMAMTLVACHGYAVRNPSRERFDVSRRAQVWARAVAELEARHYTLRVMDEGNGRLVTQVADAGFRRCGLMECAVRQQVTLRIGGDGSIACDLERTLQRPLSTEWFHPTDPDAVAAMEADQALLVRAILQGAGAETTGPTTPGAAR